MTDRNGMSNEDPCLHFEAKLVPDLRGKIKKLLIAAICDLKQPCCMWQLITVEWSLELFGFTARRRIVVVATYRLWNGHSNYLASLQEDG